MSLIIRDNSIVVEVDSSTKAVEVFRERIRESLADPGPIEADGQFHRFPTPGDAGKPTSRAAGYYLFNPAELCGLFGSFRPGECEGITFWTASIPGDTRTQEEIDRQREALRQRYEAQRRIEQEDAKHRAQAVWEAASAEINEHPYLISHGVLEAARALSGRCVRLHVESGKLIVPMLDANGVIWNRQAICDSGDKRFLDGGRVEGLALWIPAAPSPGQPYWSTEGFAKALAVHAATEQPVLCTFSAGNMLAVLRDRQQQIDFSLLTIAGDNDPSGRQAAEQARTLYPIKIVFPVEGAGDWNDVLVRQGMDALRAALRGESGGTVEVIEQPEPLYRELLPAEPYPLEALGDILGPATTALVRVIRVPVALAGQSTLSTAALCVQPHGNVIIDGRVSPLSLFLITIAESGERKSAVDHATQIPVNECQRRLVAQYRDEKTIYRRVQREFEALEKKAIKGKVADLTVLREARAGKQAAQQAAQDALKEDPPPPPLQPNIKTGDFTAEGLFKALANGQPSMGLFSDEGALFVGGHAMLQDSRLRTIATLSKLWDGSPLDRVRGGDGASLLFDRRLSLHLMMQPLVAAELLNDPIYADQGFLSRTLFAWPESTAGTRGYVPEDFSQDPVIKEYWQRLSTLLSRPFPLREGTRNELQPRNLPLAADAKALWIDYYNIIESQLADDQPLRPIRGFANKAAEQVARIAGVLAVIENPDTLVIGLPHVQSGIDLMDYYLTEALRIKDSGGASPELAQAEQLRRWMQPYPFIYPGQVYRFGPRSIRVKADAKKAIDILAKHGWLKRVDGGMEIDGMHRRDVWRVIRQQG